MAQLLMVKLSPALKLAIEQAAHTRGRNVSQFVRETVAKEMGYDLDADAALDGRGRPRRYVSDVERQRAHRDAERRRTQMQRKIVAAVMRNMSLDDMESVERYLKGCGINLESEAQALQA